MKIVSAVMAVFLLLCLCMAAQAVVTIETVRIGEAGNAADTRVMIDGTTGYGSVGYDYSIGKYEVTAAQYVEFLNAKAKTDPYHLYDAGMSGDTKYGCQLLRSGNAGSYTYSVAAAYFNRPVNYVSWYDALRFVNWLTNGQGDGDTESGSYVITNGGIDSGTVTIPTVAQRNTWSQGSTPRWLLPTENEWYKAAYYKNGAYSQYANGTNTPPALGIDSNYFGSVDHTWDGSANGALEQNGTKDMMGNVYEWNEAIISGSSGMRGGDFGGNYGYLQAEHRNKRYLGFYGSGIGLRVVQLYQPVPEPSSLIALAGGLVGLVGWRRRRG